MSRSGIFFVLAALLLAAPYTCRAGQGILTGSYVADDGFAKITFLGTRNGTPLELGQDAGSVPLDARVESPLFGIGEYTYLRSGDTVTVSPLPRDGGASGPAQAPVFRFAITGEGTLLETDTATVYRREE